MSSWKLNKKKKIIYRCGHCKMLIFTRPTLSRHLIKHTNTRPFQCEKCLKSFHDKADLLHHHKTHTKPVQCKTCLSSFSKILYLQNHLLKGCPVTDNDSRFTLLPDLRCQCNICQKILKNKANVLRHLRVHAFQERNRTSFQAGETTFATPTENLQSSEPKNLSQNVENHFQPLPNSVGFHCMICGQEFRFKSFIITHVRMHLNQRPYKCPECSKCFFARQMLKKHQQNHTRPYKCPTCNKSFIRRYLMKDHFKKRHETEDPLKDITELLDEKLIQCDICGKTMKSFQKSVMLSHIRLHKDVRPFRCKVCQKSFISDNALRKHSLNHTRPYKCHICNKGFSRRYLLTDHFKKKCSRKKKENSIVQVSSEDAPVAQITETVEDLPAPTVDASTECRPYEAKVITEQDPTTGSATYICVPCDKRFTIYDVMLRHINTFSKPTACKYCKQVFEDKHLSISHQRSCLGPSSHPPQTCSKKNKALGEQQEKIQKIMKDISQKIETLTSESSFSEITAKNLVDESLSDCVLDTVSEQVAPAKDVSGDSDVKSMRTTLERTLKVLKKGQDSLSCPECGRSFNTPRGLKIHASSHVRLFKCEVCDKDFMQISSLRAHAKIHKNSEETGTESEVDVPTRPQRKRGQQHTEVLMSEHQNWGKNDVRKGLKQSQMSTKIVSGKRRSRKVSDEGKVSDDDRVAEINLDHKDLEQVTHRLMQSGTRGRPYSCKMCRRRFTEQSGLSGHMLQNHGLRS
uniref:C2H2-type domain-containing protein n=1 Tax=Arion vulgaris TaxID=1028688 RepID=A0A0B6Y760_9EUPU